MYIMRMGSIVFIIVNREFALDGVIADEEVEDEDDVGGGEDSAGVVVNLLDIVESVPTVLFGTWSGLKEEYFNEIITTFINL